MNVIETKVGVQSFTRKKELYSIKMNYNEKGGCVFCSIQVVLVDRLQFQIETKSFRWVRVDE